MYKPKGLSSDLLNGMAINGHFLATMLLDTIELMGYYSNIREWESPGDSELRSLRPRY